MSMNTLVAGAFAAVVLVVAGVWMASGWHQAAGPVEPVKDYDQRSLEVYEFKQAGSQGAERGREIYYYKCWFCHNEFVAGPKLVGLFQRPTLLFGQKVNDETVKAQIREGSAGMPSYKHTLSETDLNDLVAYLREGCCWDDEAPPLNPRYRAERSGRPLANLKPAVQLGGAHGVVKTDGGESLEGMLVQLISDESHIRTTVYSNTEGRFEFPELDSGSYTLRIARPVEFHPYSRKSVMIEGATALPEIVLARVATNDQKLPPYPSVRAQMSGVEWLQSMPGDEDVKKIFQAQCNFCHSYQQIFRNRYDQASWRKIIYRMMHGGGSPLVNIRERGRISDEDQDRLAAWLASVRGPDAKDPEFVVNARPTGRQTKAIITEYELPRLNTALHDVTGDAQRQLWFSPHRSSFIGRVDPRTGLVQEFRVPRATPKALPGTHWITVDPRGIVWGSEVWAHGIYNLDPATGKFTQHSWQANVVEPYNSPMSANLSLDKELFLWRARYKEVSRVNPTDGKPVRTFPLTKFPSTYGSALSLDNRYWGGGAWPRDGVILLDTQTGEVFERATSPGSGPARGEFDPDGNLWSGGRGGQLVEFVNATKSVREFLVPTRYASLYTARPDKNGEVWSGELQAGNYLRFNPKSGEMIEYRLPEPFAHDRESWVDNSTDPVSVWYVDHDGWLVRIQPLD